MGSAAGRFRVRCRNCGRTVLSGVETIGVCQADDFQPKVEPLIRRPELVDPKGERWSADLGAFQAQCDVGSTG